MKTHTSFLSVSSFSFLVGIVMAFTLLLSLSLCSASLGTYKSGECVQIKTILNTTSVNISTINYPNSSVAVSNKAMTKNAYTFNYTFCSTNDLGVYVYDYFDTISGNVYVNDFEITRSGEASSSAKATFYFGFVFILVIFLIFSIMGIFKIEDYKGRFALYWVSHLLIIAISFMVWTGADTFLTTTPFLISFFKIIFYFTMIGAFPMIILSLAWIFKIHLINDDVQKMMDRGIDEDEAYDRASKKRGRRK